jgi:hypothetical protein
MAKAFIKPFIKAVTKGEVSSAAKKLAGTSYKVKGTSEFKTIKTIYKESSNIRSIVFDDDLAVKVNKAEIHDLVREVGGGITKKAKAVEAKKGVLTYHGEERTPVEYARDVKNRCFSRETYGSRRAAQIALDAYRSQTGRIKGTLPKYTIVEDQGLYGLMDADHAKRLANIGELNIPKGQKGGKK